MRRTLILSAILILGGAAHAQAQLTPDPINGYTLAIFTGAATDPNVSTPVATPVVYPLAQVQCGLPRIPDPVGVVTNPLHQRFDDPVDAALPVAQRRQCETTVTQQIAPLPIANNYKGAIRANSISASSAYGAFSNSFNRVPVAPVVPTGLTLIP